VDISAGAYAGIEILPRHRQYHIIHNHVRIAIKWNNRLTNRKLLWFSLAPLKSTTFGFPSPKGTTSPFCLLPAPSPTLSHTPPRKTFHTNNPTHPNKPDTPASPQAPTPPPRPPPPPAPPTPPPPPTPHTDAATARHPRPPHKQQEPGPATPPASRAKSHPPPPTRAAAPPSRASCPSACPTARPRAGGAPRCAGDAAPARRARRRAPTRS
jgi:hypothetical protein